MRIGIVGAEAAKFTPYTEDRAKVLIRSLLHPGDTVISGKCHLGGIDIWAAEIGGDMGLEVIEFEPRELSWSKGYMSRNYKIAKESDSVVCITLRELPPDYNGMRFKLCYHCKSTSHVKSGGCWTMKKAKQMGKPTQLYVILPELKQIRNKNETETKQLDK